MSEFFSRYSRWREKKDFLVKEKVALLIFTETKKDF